VPDQGKENRSKNVTAPAPVKSTPAAKAAEERRNRFNEKQQMI